MSVTPPTEAPNTGGHRQARSLLLVNTGDGKGKTTAAMGVALRALARGWRVLIVQFVKSGEWRAGEQDALQRLGAEWRALGDGFSWNSDDLEASAELARDAWRTAAAAIQAGEHDVVILDEFTYPMTWGWVAPESAVSVLAGRPSHVNVVVTGRDAPEALIDVADTVTRMQSVKHAFDAGVLARRGIDF